MAKNKVIVILGPTSSGKSDAAILLAKKFGGEIVSADSRQVYRGMNLGTGKVIGSLEPIIPESRSDRDIRDLRHKPQAVFISEGIPHHMIDVVNPNTDYNVSKYKKRAQKIIKDILKRGRLPIICGGTGFWIKALVDNIDFPEVKPDWELRERLNKETPEVLFKMLRASDPERAKNIDAKNKVRLIRAIEICRALGEVPKINKIDSSTSPSTRFARSGSARNDSYNFFQIGINLPKEILDGRIKARLKKRFDAGMIEEVDRLHKGNQTYLIHNTKYSIPKISWRRLESFGLEYYWISQYLQNKIELSSMQEKLYFDSIHYAKRQMTWFRKDKRIVWLSNYQEIESVVSDFLR